MWTEKVEGKTTLLVPERGTFGTTAGGRDKKAPVFYNPRMKLNRDVTCAVVRALARDGDVEFLDLLSGSGAKGIRVAKETGAGVHLNDASSEAVKAIKRNAKKNRLLTKVTITKRNANLLLQERPREFNFIDIDPFGPPVPFLENALMTVREGGYLGITATDTAPLCGVYPMSCYRKYGAVPLRCEFCHEAGLRILVGHAARAAARYSRAVKCLLSHSTEHYFRAYVQVREGKEKAKACLENLGYVYYCRRCLAHSCEKALLPSRRTCECGNGMETAGPLWLGRIKDDKFAKAVLEESSYLNDKKLTRLLETIAGEIHEPFYQDTHRLAKVDNLEVKPMKEIIAALSDYKVSRTHFNPVAVKTDAPLGAIKKVLSG
jgi:tRNA (guanine26-N2/guanine27-N2)-dimethyltransferase